MQRFWDLEEYNELPKLSAADQRSEEYFDATTTRDENGRFIVSLPILGNTELLRNSEAIAFKRLVSIEKKLSRNATLKQQYIEFLDEYLKLGHMEEIKREEIGHTHYFLPHHYVLKPGSSTTKLRVVFDASAKTNSNLSLNDLMLAGPKIQDDLISIILRFRMKKYVFTADIKQMYRQIQVTEEDKNLQLIMWRTDPSEAVKYYRLCTVTYGTKTAPYLAVKCLQQLAVVEESRYPLGSKTIRNFYVDDVMTGSDDIAETVKMQKEIQELLKSGGFELHKWCANHPELIKNIPKNKLELQLQFHEKDDSHIKTLGLLWHPVTDHFGITTEPKLHQRITKRNILSDTAQIYDPLGLINPVVVTSKIFLQDLWKLKLDWDDELPEELQTKWSRFIQEVPKLASVQVPRYVFGHERALSKQLHVFCDASEKAYGAVSYIRSKNEAGIVTIRLLCAKSRVAPVKPTSLPRLELCGAKLASNLVNRVIKNIDETLDEIIYWTDSQIVLSWLRKDPTHLKTFVANRISNILELSSPNQWRYVPSNNNPADLISRGTLPEQLLGSKLWFSGPEFLQNPKSMWPHNIVENISVEEEKPLKFALNAIGIEQQEHPLYKIDHGNSFIKLVRVMAYIRRAVKCLKNKTRFKDKFLTTRETEEATRDIVREIQQNHFEEEIKMLKKHNQVRPSSKLLSLAPFLDEHGVLRVGGRIEEADITYDAKHPLLLPGDHFVSKLIYSHLHIVNLHAGPQALNSIVRQKYWILQGRNLARSTVANCVRCIRLRPRLMNQVMGNLPSNRVQQARPFYNCGVDFCGPVYTHFKIRGKRPLKSYIAVFCCFATKATHLEVVSDLTTEGFIAALKRFIARRGKCQKIFCDNAKNFVGAKNQLDELYNILNNHNAVEKIKTTASIHNIEFKFIPPRAPHFGGLWEAAVKSTKTLLYRSIASASLTYEELCTVTAEIEAIFNSRPLSAASSDPNDLAPLTPAHFIIGEPMTANPDPFTMQSKMSLASRWALVSQIRVEFWKRWSVEYLHLLQQRAKWAKEYPNVVPGTLVLVKEDNQPPLKWQMGRVLETIEGPDGKMRVVIVRTATGTYRRPIHNLAPLIPDFNYKDNEDTIEECESTEQDKGVKGQQEQNNHENKRQLRKRRNSGQSAMNCLKVFLLTSLVMPVLTANTQPIEVTSLNNESGIYFERLGNSMITGSEWKIVVYYNLTNYWTALKTVEQGIDGMKKLARTIKNNDYQREIVEEYQHQIRELKAYNQLFMNETKQKSEGRFKRSKSPLNFIGSAFHALIGVLDDDYAEEMSQTIDKTKQNEDHLLKLIQNQTTVLETTINIMKKSDEEKNKQMKFVEENTEKIYERLSNMNVEMKQSRAIEGFNVLSLLCSAMLQGYKDNQNAILDIITTTQHGKLNPLILTPDQLMSQLIFIKNHLQSSLQLPFALDEQVVLNAYRLINVRYRLKNNYAIFVVTVPLVRETKFELYKVYPLPAHINNTFVSIETKTSYILISAHRDRFYHLTELHLFKGIQINEEMYLIHQRGPIYNKNAQQNCEIELFTQLRLPASCKLKLTNPTSMWIQLKTLNHWLFNLDKKYIVKVESGKSH